MLCVEVRTTDGALVPSDPQPAVMSDCTLVVQSSAEVVNNPFRLTDQEAAQIGAAIALVWAVAWAFRVAASWATETTTTEES